MQYDKSELLGKSGTDLQVAAQRVKQKFDVRRQFFHSKRNLVPDVDRWERLNQLLTDIDAKHYTPFNQTFMAVVKAENADKLIEHFDTLAKEFSEIEKVLPEYVPTESREAFEVNEFKKEVMSRIEEDIFNLKSEIASSVKDGISSLLTLKGELGLQKNYKEAMDNELSKTRIAKRLFMGAFIVCVLAIPVLLYFSFTLDAFKGQETIHLYVLRSGATVSLALLSYFFFHQYRLYQLIGLRYTHLQGLLGGGATFIGEIIGSENKDVRHEINRKMADLFMDFENISGIAREANHPIDLSSKKTAELLEQATKLVSAARGG